RGTASQCSFRGQLPRRRHFVECLLTISDAAAFSFRNTHRLPRRLGIGLLTTTFIAAGSAPSERYWGHPHGSAKSNSCRWFSTYAAALLHQSDLTDSL